MKTLAFICIFFIFFGKSMQITENETSLVLLQMMIRHGARTILIHYPNDINQDYWDKHIVGDIVPKGMTQVQEFGNFLAQKYGSFLGTSYNSSRVFARSTDYSRTIITTSIILSSLFQPSSDQHWTDTPGLNTWMPIPVHTTNSSADDILAMDYICPVRMRLEDQLKFSSEYLKVQKENQEFIEKMSNISGVNFELLTMRLLADKYIVQTFLGLPNEQYLLDNIDRLMNLNDLFYHIHFGNFEIAKLNMGSLLKEVVNNMKNKIAGSSNQLFVYGIHDFLVSAMQRILNISTELTQPEYVSSFVIELRMDAKGSYYVQVLFKNNKSFHPIELNPVSVNGCETICPFDKFIALVKDSIVADLASACKIGS